MDLIADIVYETEKYLNLKERLYWSSVNKEYYGLINRKKIKLHISAIHLNNYIKINFPISHETSIIEDIKCFMEPKNDFWTLRFISDDILNKYNIHTYSYWVNSTKYYKVNKIIISQDIWDTSPRIIQNQRVCAVYRFRKLGIMKKKITTSLNVKALIY